MSDEVRGQIAEGSEESERKEVLDATSWLFSGRLAEKRREMGEN